MGRTAQPKSLKALEGKYIAPTHGDIQLTPMRGLPDPPEALNFDDDERNNDRAKKIWRSTVGILHESGLLSVVHLNDIATYCVEQARYWLCIEKVKEQGYLIEHKSGYQYPNPYLAIGNKSLANVRAIATKYGLTPIDASKITLPTKDEGNDLDNLLSE